MTDLLATVTDFLRQSGMADTTFGRQAMGDPNFVFDLREGRDYRVSTVQRVEKFIADKTQNEAAK